MPTIEYRLHILNAFKAESISAVTKFLVHAGKCISSLYSCSLSVLSMAIAISILVCCFYSTKSILQAVTQHILSSLMCPTVVCFSSTAVRSCYLMSVSNTMMYTRECIFFEARMMCVFDRGDISKELHMYSLFKHSHQCNLDGLCYGLGDPKAGMV